MTLKDLLTAQYGVGVHHLTNKLKRFKLKLSSSKNRTIFLERCRHFRVVPKFLKQKCPIKSRRACKLTIKYQLSLLRECLSQTRGQWRRNTENIKRIVSTLNEKLTPEHFDVVKRITDASYEKDFLKRKKKLKDKFEKLHPTSKRHVTQLRPTTISNPVLQLQDSGPLPPEAIGLLNLGPKFSVTPKEIPKMEIIAEVEKASLALERIGKGKEADELRHQAAHILLKAKTPKSNLTAQQKKGLNYFNRNKNIAVAPFDKGQGFVTLERGKLIDKAQAEFKNTSLDTKNSTAAYERKIQAKLREKHKEGKLDDKTYKACYPSGSITPSASVAIKAHKPAKNHPARVITSHIGAPQEGLASHLNTLLKPYIDESSYVCKNSTKFVEKIKNLSLLPDEKMFSYDAEALFPSVPITDCIAAIHSKLVADDQLINRTKLTPDDIAELLHLCLSSSDFVFDSRHHTANDTGPIGLSLMVTVAQFWMIHTMTKAVAVARERNVPIPQNLQVYMDDCWCTMLSQPPRRPGLRSASQYVDPAEAFNQCLNSVHPRVKFTRESEENNKIAFLDVLITREENGQLSTQMYRKPTNTNVIIKPQSAHDPRIHTASFKGELCRAHRLCTSSTQTQREIDYILNVYEDNGHNRKQLEATAKNYTPPEGSKNQHPSDDTTISGDGTNSSNRGTNIDTDASTSSLFGVLPFHEPPEDDVQLRPFACIPFIPSISYQLKRALGKAGCKTFFKAGNKLQNILCSKNKTHPNPMDTKGVYKIQCPCAPEAIYIGETARSFATRTKEHRKAVESGKWSHSGLTQHKEHCDKPIDWDNPEIIARLSHKDKGKLKFDLRLRESLEIRRHGCGPNKGLNEDWGSYVRSQAWTPVFNQL
jgi:hypothetical protein